MYVTSIFIFCFFECPSETPSLETPVARRIFNMMMLRFIISLSHFFLWLQFHYSTQLSEQSSILLDTFLILRILKTRNNFNKKSPDSKRTTNIIMLPLDLSLKYFCINSKIILLIFLFIGIGISFLQIQ